MKHNVELAKRKIKNITEINNIIKSKVNIFYHSNDLKINSTKLQMDHRKQYESICLRTKIITSAN